MRRAGLRRVARDRLRVRARLVEHVDRAIGPATVRLVNVGEVDRCRIDSSEMSTLW